jgi:hypothetical protein
VLMVILGAGASYDSSPDWPTQGQERADRPPLANDLFHERYRRFRDEFPQFLGLLAELVPKSSRSIEEVLQRLQNDSRSNPARLQQLTAIRYYLQSLVHSTAQGWLNRLSGHTTYNNLVEQIEQHRNPDETVCFVTFNYDTLLESALSRQLGMQFENVPDYVSHPNYQVFKLHGSTNWGRSVNRAPTRLGGSWKPKDVIQEPQAFGISDHYVTAHGYSGPPLYPAIAIPVTDKQVFECPNDHVGQLQALIPDVTKLLTVGWRGMERHFLKMLNTLAPASIACVAGTQQEADLTLRCLRGANVAVSDFSLLAGFTDSIGDRKLEAFFAN